MMMTVADADFLGVFPGWIGDLLSILGVPAILLAIVVYVLNRKSANRKLVVDEGSLKRTEFESFTAAQNTALERAGKEAKEAKAEADEVSDRLDVMDGLYDQMRESIIWLRSYVKKITSMTGYAMTASESREFEATKPPPRPPRRRV